MCNEEADGSTEEFAVAGMGLQELPAAAAEGSGGEGMVPGDAGPPAHGMLDDAVSQLVVVDPSSGEGADGESEPAAAVLTSESSLPRVTPCNTPGVFSKSRASRVTKYTRSKSCYTG